MSVLADFVKGRNCACLPTVFLGAFLSLSPMTRAAEETAPSSSETANEEIERTIPTAPVIVDGNTLFSVRGLVVLSAEDRALAIANRVKTLAADHTFATQMLKSIEVPAGTEILGGDRHIIMLVTDPDADLEGVKRQVLAHVYSDKVAHAIDAFRLERHPKVLIRQTAYALGAVLVLMLALWTGRITVRRIGTTMETRYKEKIRDVGIQSFRVLSAKHIWKVITGLFRGVCAIGALTAIYVCAHYVLLLFPWTRGFARRLFGFLMSPLYTVGTDILKATPKVMFLAVLAVVTLNLLKLIRLFFSAVDKGAVTLSGFDPAWARPTFRLVRVLVIAFALVAAYPYIPWSNSEAFKGMSLLIGLIFSLGSTSLMGNMISGYSLAYRRTFHLGDRVKIGDIVGDVQDSKLMVTHLRTIKNEIVVVPNSKIINEEVVNYSALAQKEGLILHTTVRIGYEVPWRQVEAILLEAVSRTPGLLRRPEPYVRQIELGTFAVTYEINAYCNEPAQMGLRYTLLNQNVLDVFNEYGVQIMTPAYEGDPEDAKVVSKDRWYSSPASRDRREDRIRSQGAAD